MRQFLKLSETPSWHTSDYFHVLNSPHGNRTASIPEPKTSTSANVQLDAEQVFKLLSSRINVENSLMRNDLKKLEEKIDLKNADMNKKIDSISSRISLLERDQGKIATEDLQQDTNNGQAQNRGINFDNIESQLTIFRQALNGEKQLVRKLESAIVDKTDFLTENLSAINVKIENNENEMNRLNETFSQAFIVEKQNLLLLESLFVYNFESLSEKQNKTMDIIERQEEKMKLLNQTLISDYDMFNQQLEKINQTQDLVEGQIKTMSQEQTLLSQDIKVKTEELGTNQNNLNRKTDQILNKQRSLDSTIQNNQRSLNQVLNKQSSLDSAIQSNLWSVNQIVNRMEERKVAFYTELDTTREFSVGSKIVFNNIMFQEGSGYSRYTGVFTCPVSGVYMFSVVLTNENSAHTSLQAQLKVDSKTKIDILSEKDDDQQNDQSSNLAIIKLYSGAKVWVEIFKRSAVVREYQSTFSGALLYT